MKFGKFGELLTLPVEIGDALLFAMCGYSILIDYRYIKATKLAYAHCASIYALNQLSIRSPIEHYSILLESVNWF